MSLLARSFPSFLLTIALLITSCAQNPVTGKSEWQVVSERDEIHLGEQVYSYMQQVEGGDYLAHPEIQQYVSQVGKRLAAASDRPHLPYEFVVLNNSVPNAWALPGGKVAINRGLLIYLKSEAELAAVLGHEIVHAAARHGAKAMERDIWLNLGAKTVEIAVSESASAMLVMTAVGTGAQLISMKYSRAAESEADHYGMIYMSKAGYNPAAAIELQKIFLSLEKSGNRSWAEGLFASHPPSQQRMEANAQFANKLGETGTIGTQEYTAAIRPLMEVKAAYEKGDAAAIAYNKKDLDTAYSLAKEASALEPKEGFFDALLGAVAFSRDDYPSALAHFDQAIEKTPHYWAFFMARGKTKKAQGDYAGAKKDLQESFRLLPTEEVGELLKQDFS